MIIVTAPLWLWSGGRWHFITVPEADAVEIRAHSLLNRGGFGSVKVEATIGDVTWRTSVFPQKSAATCFRSRLKCGAGRASRRAMTSR